MTDVDQTEPQKMFRDIVSNRAIARPAPKHTVTLEIWDRSLRMILYFDLSLYSYRIMSQELDPAHYTSRRMSALFSSDEAHFTSVSSINTRNFYYWAEHNPRIIQESPIDFLNLMVWRAVSQLGVILLWEGWRYRDPEFQSCGNVAKFLCSLEWNR